MIAIECRESFSERWLNAVPIAARVARRYFRRSCDIDDVTQHMLSQFPTIDERYPGGDVPYEGFVYRSFRYQLLNWWRAECNRGTSAVSKGVELRWVLPDSLEPPDEVDRAYVGIRDCVQCGREFAPTVDHVLVCSRECRAAIDQRRETIGIIAREMVAILDRLKRSTASIADLRSTCERPLSRIVQLRDFGFVIPECRGVFSLNYAPIPDSELPTKIVVASIDSLPLRNCPWCSSQFSPATVSQIFCTEDCGAKYRVRDARWKRQNEQAEILLAMLKNGPKSAKGIKKTLGVSQPIVLINALRDMGHHIISQGTRRQGFVYRLSVN